MKRRFDRRGFTLAELLIVVAIIGLLAAIAIPVFSASRDKAERTVCLANLASSQHLSAMEYLLNPDLTASAAAAFISQSVGPLDKLCPAGGRYTVETQPGGKGFLIVCSIHGKTAVQSVNENISSLLNSAALRSYFKDANRQKNGTLDSTGPNFGGGIKQELAKALGITQDFDFCIQGKGTSGYVAYIFEPVNGKAAGDQVSVTKYVISTDWTPNGQSSLGAALLQNKRVNDASGKPINYLALDTGSYQTAK